MLQQRFRKMPWWQKSDESWRVYRIFEMINLTKPQPTNLTFNFLTKKVKHGLRLIIWLMMSSYLACQWFWKSFWSIYYTSDYASPGFAGFCYKAPRKTEFWLFLAFFGSFWRIFLPICILGQFVITPYSNIFWSVQSFRRR